MADSDGAPQEGGEPAAASIVKMHETHVPLSRGSIPLGGAFAESGLLAEGDRVPVAFVAGDDHSESTLVYKVTKLDGDLPPEFVQSAMRALKCAATDSVPVNVSLMSGKNCVVMLNSDGKVRAPRKRRLLEAAQRDDGGQAAAASVRVFPNKLRDEAAATHRFLYLVADLAAGHLRCLAELAGTMLGEDEKAPWVEFAKETLIRVGDMRSKLLEQLGDKRRLLARVEGMRPQ